MRFEFRPFDALPDVVLVRPRIHRDDRGWFAETWREDDFAARGIPAFVQDGHSRSARGVLRGLHFQRAPMAQGKLVRCSRGEVYDAAVDIRPASPTFGRWVAARLAEDTQDMLWIPEGFAHGFVALTEAADVQYRLTRAYSPEHEGCLRWDSVGIPWPVDAPRVGDKDARGVALADLGR